MTGLELQEFRLSLGYSQKQMARYLGYGENYIRFAEGILQDRIPFELYEVIRKVWPSKNEPIENEFFEQPRSPLYNFVYHKNSMSNPCAKQNDAESQEPMEAITVTPAIFASTKKSTPKNTPISFSETTLSVGDITSQLLLNTGSNSYKRLITWLEGV